jgi:hypothetical protein
MSLNQMHLWWWRRQLQKSLTQQMQQPPHEQHDGSPVKNRKAAWKNAHPPVAQPL